MDALPTVHQTPPGVLLRVGARVDILNASADVESAIGDLLTYNNPDHERRRRLGLYLGETPETIATWTPLAGGGISIPRGAARRVAALLHQRNVPYAVDDATVAPRLDLKLTPGTLRPYQQAAITDLVATRSGVCVMPTGAGKTNVLLSVIARLMVTALIVVHTRELVRQTAERCRTWLGVEPGIIGDGKWDPRPITIASVQTLARRDLSALWELFGLLAVDEVHHAPARSWAPVFDQFPARHRYGLSATPLRRDGLEFLLDDYIGPVTSRVSSSTVREAGATVPVRVETIPTAMVYDLGDDPGAYTAMISALAADPARNQLLVEVVRDRCARGASVLVLTDRVGHARLLAEALMDCAPVVLTGDLRASERDARMAAIRAGARLTIATASLLGEGVDAPGWDTLVMASPFAGGARTTQAVGRVVRPAPGKREAVVVDIVDVRVPALVAAAKARARVYRREEAA